MNYFDEYCEVHLDHSTAPYKWVFRSDEKILIRFGVHLSKHPHDGQIVYELNDGQGYCEVDCIQAQAENIIENGFQMFSVTLPKIANGGGYEYKLGYIDTDGKQHTSERSRFLLICDQAPHSITEIPSIFLGMVNNQPVYGPPPSISMTPSPKDWNSRLFYSIIIDRFALSQNTNHTSFSPVTYDPSSPHSSHGGTIQGIIEKIEYLKSLGIGTIIISPVYVNAPDGYHGYHPIHLLMVDPHLGTLESLRELVRKAHEFGIAVILDVVNNHLADSINWEEYGGPPGGEFKYVQGEELAVMPFPIEARNTSLFHGPEYTDMVNQRLFGFLEDWRTETTFVRELLTQHLKYWIAETDIDGFRYDSARHVGLDFWQPCVAEIFRYANILGKKEFIQIAEHAGSTHEQVIEYNDAKFSGLIDYPTYYTIKHSLGDANWLSGLADYFCGFLEPSQSYHAGWQNNIMFLDNQDTSRIFHEFLNRIPDRNEARIRVHFALACLILGPQIPSIYQGTEQEFDGALGFHEEEGKAECMGHDCYVREDLFDNPVCTWKFGLINRKIFQPYDQNNPTFLLINQLAKIRFQHPLIANGRRTLLLSEDDGIWCLLIHDETEQNQILAIMNLGNIPASDYYLQIPQSYPEFGNSETLIATSGGIVEVVAPGKLLLQIPAFTFIVVKMVN
ncbi:MAG: alpha-amylase [Sphaerospermopsis sp. SIO1G1]|nr:alpha-amylase [Sphaerospermopsis sp. SIO1G1]